MEKERDIFFVANGGYYIKIRELRLYDFKSPTFAFYSLHFHTY